MSTLQDNAQRSRHFVLGVVALNWSSFRFPGIGYSTVQEQRHANLAENVQAGGESFVLFTLSAWRFGSSLVPAEAWALNGFVNSWLEERLSLLQSAPSPMPRSFGLWLGRHRGGSVCC